MGTDRTFDSMSNEVSEADAVGEVKAIFADIRRTMAMPFVNLIWRRLAIAPAALSWTWETMKPLYSDGAIYDEAAQLLIEQALPPVPKLPPAALRAVGIDEPAETSIRATLAGYDRANPLNLIAFSAILTRLEESGTPPIQLDEGAIPAQNNTQNAAKSAAPPPVPRLLSFEEMDESTAELVHAVSRIGARDIARSIPVSLPRNLAHWPGFLSLYLAALRPLHDSGQLYSAIDAVLTSGHIRGTRLAPKLGNTGVPVDCVEALVRAPIETLVPHAMGRMIPIVSLLQRIMPN